MSEVPLPFEQPSSPITSRTPSVDLDAFPDKAVRRPLQIKFEKQGIKPTGTTQSARASRRPSITQSVRRPSSSKRTSVVSSCHSSRQSSRVGFDFDSEKLAPVTPPAESPLAPSRPDFNEPPYANASGPVFGTEEWTSLIDKLEDNVQQVLLACQSVAESVNLDERDLRWTGLHYNIVALDEMTIREITRDCWYIMYEIISIGYTWYELVQEGSLLERLMRNLRQSQSTLRWDIPCDIMLALGFTEKWLYE